MSSSNFLAYLPKLRSKEQIFGVGVCLCSLAILFRLAIGLHPYSGNLVEVVGVAHTQTDN